MTVWDLVYHVFTHFGIAFLMIPIIAYIAWRTGQLTQPQRAAALPLDVSGVKPDDSPGPRRFPLVALVLAILLGVGLGVPVATTLIASKIADPGAAVTTTEEKGH